LIAVAKKRCLFCNEALPRDKRSDARYCSDRCRKASRRAQSGGLIWLRTKTEVLNPLINGHASDTDVHKVIWSGPVPCQTCGRLTKTGFTMTMHGSSEWWRACSLNHLSQLVDT
jgi:predicted nucleic acid-binding Zn ribbon protein